MSFTRQSILAIVMAIVASGQAQADWQSWIPGQSLKNLGNSIALELGRVFYKAPKCIYENTSKSEKVVGACALFGTVGTGYYFYKKYQNARNVHRNCDTDYVSLEREYKDLKIIHQKCNAEYNKLERTHNDLLKIHQSCNDTGSKSNSNNSPKSSSPVQSGNTVPLHNMCTYL